MEILNKTEITEPSTLFFILAACTIVFLFACLGNLDKDAGLVFLLLCIICFIGVMIITVFGEEIPTGRYKYEVILDKSYSATELYENYDVVEQRGKIWVIEDKEE